MKTIFLIQHCHLPQNTKVVTNNHDQKHQLGTFFNSSISFFHGVSFFLNILNNFLYLSPLYPHGKDKHKPLNDSLLF